MKENSPYKIIDNQCSNQNLTAPVKTNLEAERYSHTFPKTNATIAEILVHNGIPMEVEAIEVEPIIVYLKLM
jgi:hypothetical protein